MICCEQTTHTRVVIVCSFTDSLPVLQLVNHSHWIDLYSPHMSWLLRLVTDSLSAQLSTQQKPNQSQDSIFCVRPIIKKFGTKSGTDWVPMQAKFGTNGLGAYAGWLGSYAYWWGSYAETDKTGCGVPAELKISPPRPKVDYQVATHKSLSLQFYPDKAKLTLQQNTDQAIT